MADPGQKRGAERGSGRAPGRVRRALAAAGSALGLAVVFVGAAAGGLVLHLDTAAARRVARGITNDVLGSLFEGKIIADEIDALSLSGVRIRAAVAVDPAGGQVIRASGIEARADVAQMLRDIVFGQGELLVEIPYIRIEHADVLIEASPSGGVTIGDAFTPRPPKRPSKPREPKAPPRPVRVALSHIEIGRGWVHGAVAPPRSLDADVNRLTGAVHVSPEGVAVDVEQTGLVDRAFLPARTAGTANYHLRAGKQLLMWTAYAGQVGEVEVSARGVLQDGHIEASASAPRVSPGALSSLIPGHPFTAPIAASVAIDGDAPTFDVEADITALAATSSAPGDAGSVSVEGRLDATGPLRFEADATARAVDPRAVGITLPAGKGPAPTLSAEGRVRGEIAGAPRLIVDARTEPTAIADQPVPAADVHLVLDRGALSGIVRLHEEGMPIDAAFAVEPEDRRVRFVAKSDIAAISAAPRIRGTVDGSARIAVEGTVQQGGGGEGGAAGPVILDARVTGTVAGLRAGGKASLGSGRVQGRLYGPVDDLEVDASLRGQDLEAGGTTFASVEASARGKVASPELRATLTDGPDAVRASARLAPKTGALRGVHVAVRRDGQEVEGTIDRVSPGRGGVEIEGIALEGAGVGALSGGLKVHGDDVTGSLRGEGVDLDKVSELLGIPQRIRGIANLEVSLERGKEGHRGKLLLELENGEASILSGVSAQIAATIEDDHWKLDGLVRVVATDGAPAQAPRSVPDKKGVTDELRCNGTIASVRVSHGEGTLKGPLLRASTWAALDGSVDVAAEDWDLGCLARILPGIALFVSDVRGKLTTHFHVARPPEQRFPSVSDFVARTRGLEIAGPQSLGDDAPAWASRSIDGQLKGSIDGTTGRAEATLTLYDGELLGDVSASVELDLPTLVDHPERRAASLAASRVAGTIALPRRAMRSFKTLPTFVTPYLPPIDGEVRLDAYVNGTIARPFVAVRALGFGIADAPGDPEEAPAAFPTDIDALLTYDSAQATLDAHVSKGSQEIATVAAKATAAIDDLRRAGAGAPWTGGFVVKLNEVPLGELPVFGDNDIGGHLSGKIAMSGLGTPRDPEAASTPTLSAELSLPDLKIGDDLFFEEGSLSLKIQPQAVEHVGVGPRSTATARVEIVAQDGGRLDATAYAGIRWKDGLVPTVDGGRAADLYARVERFRLAAVQPLTRGVLSKLDGLLDGDLRIGWRRAAEGEAGAIEADMLVSEGVVHIPELGQELREATVRVRAKDGFVRFDDVSAAGASGRIQGWALARMNGLSLRDAGGALTIKKGEELPLTVEGVPLGNAYGEISFIADKREGELKVEVRVPRLHIALPATSARNVQPLEDNPDIILSHPLGPEKERRAADALRYALTIKLGDVEVEGSGVRVHLTSAKNAPPQVLLTDEAHVSGDVLLTSGQLEVFGKVFELERGLVRLRPEETSNPYLNATAHWDAPDGTRVYIDYVGLLKPITNEKLRFRSNPPSSQKDILARLLFDADANQGSPDTNARQAAGGVAVGVGGELASAQFNTILNGITPLRGLSTRFGTTSEGALRTSVSYELDERLTALASYEGAPSGAAGTSSTTGTSAPGGTASQRTGRTEVSVDWRFHKNWSLRGTVGVGGAQAGSGILDLLWQYRY